MKKLPLFILIWAFTIGHSSAVELWNDFTTDMTELDVISRASEILRLQRDPNRITNIRRILPSGNFMGDYITLREFPVVLHVLSGLDGLYVSRQGQSNISFFFHSEKLFGVVVRWAAEADDLLRLATQQFGQPTILRYTDTIPIGRPPESTQMWRLQGRDMFIGRSTTWGRDRRDFIFIDQNAQRQYQAEIIAERNRREAEEEARRRAAAGAIIF